MIKQKIRSHTVGIVPAVCVHRPLLCSTAIWILTRRHHGIETSLYHFFVTDLDKETKFYSDILNLKAVDIRPGWSQYKVSKDFSIAFHKGKGKRPRLTFTTNGDIAQVRDELVENGARLSPLKEHGNGVLSCKGKDKEGLTIEIFNSN